jgi:hypothetical protein
MVSNRQIVATKISCARVVMESLVVIFRCPIRQIIIPIFESRNEIRPFTHQAESAVCRA